MHVLMLVGIGLAGLAAHVVVGHLLRKAGMVVDAPYIFLWFWLLFSILNAVLGLMANIPLVNEIAAFIPIFGIPAGAAWYLSRTSRGLPLW